ncbi:MAG: hypothetical protein AAFZ15_15345 [Bacteroidota bacterium]
MNLLFIHSNREVRISPDLISLFEHKYPGLKVFCSSGADVSLKEFSLKDWGKTPKKIEDVSFDVTMRHGGDKPSSIQVQKAISAASLSIIFGGDGYDYKFRMKDELHFIRRVSDDHPFKPFELDTILKYAAELKSGVESPVPSILLQTIVETEIASKYTKLFKSPPPGSMHKSAGNQAKIQLPHFLKILFDGVIWNRKLPNGSAGKKCLVIWNEFPLEMNASEYETNEVDFLFSNSLSINAEELQPTHPFDFEKYSSVFVCAELEIDINGLPAPLQAGAGLKVARELRLHGLRQPIVICSVQTEKEVRSKDAYDLLATPGHYFYNLERQVLNKSLNEGEGLIHLSELELEDIVEFHLKSGKFREILHYLEGNAGRISDFGTLEKIIENGFRVLEHFFKEKFVANHKQANAVKDEILQQLMMVKGEGKKEDAIRRGIVEAKKEELRGLLVVNGTSDIEVNKGWHEILYIEDDPIQRERFLQDFEKINKRILKSFKSDKEADSHQVIECITFGSGKGGLEKLKEMKNRCPVVIIDWRLLEPTKQEWQREPDWQPMQGLSVIAEIGSNPVEFPRPVAFFMLTDRAGGILDMAKKTSRYRIHWYAKRDVGRSDTDFAEFANDVIREGNLMRQKWTDLPSKRWNAPSLGKNEENHTFLYPLKTYYRNYLIKANHVELKRHINSQALSYLIYARLANDGLEPMIPEKNRLILLSRLTSQSLEEDLPKFYPKMIARRIYLALLEIDQYTKKNIYSLLYKGISYKKLEKETSTSKKIKNPETTLANYKKNFRTYTANHLAIMAKSENAFKLPEEEEWLAEVEEMEKEKIRQINAKLEEIQAAMYKRKDVSFDAKKIAENERNTYLFESPVDMEQGKSFLKDIYRLTSKEEFAAVRVLWQDLINEIGHDDISCGLLVRGHSGLVAYCRANRQLAEEYLKEE